MEELKPNPEAPQPTPEAPKPNTNEILELLKQIESENAEQVRFAQKQYRMSCVRTACSVLTLVLVVVIAAIFVPQLRQTLAQVDTVLAQVDTVLDNLESTTAELAALVPQLSQSVPALVENLDALVATSSEEITTALQKISSLDVDSLNIAIHDLQSIVEPLARLFGTR